MPVKTVNGMCVSDIKFNDMDTHTYAVSGYVRLLGKRLNWDRQGKKYSDIDLPYDLVMC